MYTHVPDNPAILKDMCGILAVLHAYPEGNACAAELQ